MPLWELNEGIMQPECLEQYKHLIHISYYHYHYYQVKLSKYHHKVLRLSLWGQLWSHITNHELLLRKRKEVTVYTKPYREDFLAKLGEYEEMNRKCLLMPFGGLREDTDDWVKELFVLGMAKSRSCPSATLSLLYFISGKYINMKCSTWWILRFYLNGQWTAT